nr:hypothetical protein [Tanacetum cinerariifolium]
MDDPDITMEEYVRHETERALKNGKVYNLKTATYGDDASWSTVVEEGEPVDAAGSGATTLGIGAMTSGDDASWSTVVEEGEPVDAAGSGATTSGIGAMTSGGTNSVEKGGFGTSPKLIVTGVIS